MSKITCIVLCVVAASLTKVTQALSEEDKAKMREAIAPILAQCSEAEGVSEEDIEAAKKAPSVDALNSCFIRCVMQKTEALNDKGLFDSDSALAKIKPFVSSDEDFAKFEEVAKECMSVNEKEVSDGEAGCDRAKLILACFLEHKAEFLIFRRCCKRHDSGIIITEDIPCFIKAVLRSGQYGDLTTYSTE